MCGRTDTERNGQGLVLAEFTRKGRAGNRRTPGLSPKLNNSADFAASTRAVPV